MLCGSAIPALPNNASRSAKKRSTEVGWSGWNWGQVLSPRSGMFTSGAQRAMVVGCEVVGGVRVRVAGGGGGLAGAELKAGGAVAVILRGGGRWARVE